MNARKLKGEQIAKTVQIKKEGMNKWLVPSQSGRGAYTVNRQGEASSVVVLTLRIDSKSASTYTQ